MNSNTGLYVGGVGGGAWVPPCTLAKHAQGRLCPPFIPEYTDLPPFHKILNTALQQ